MIRRNAFLFLIFLIASLSAAQQNSATANAEALIQRLGTGNINDEDAAKAELQRHPTPETLCVLLKALPSAGATVRDDIIDILAVYKDEAKIPALIAYRKNGWVEKSVDSQLVELGGAAANALITSLPETCEPAGQNRAYAAWVGTVLREIEPEGTRALLTALTTDKNCLHEAARSGLVVPRPGPPMAPPPTSAEQDADAGLFLLVDASENDDPKVRRTAVDWIHALQNRGWPNPEYSQFIESMIANYRSGASVQTQTEVARLLSRNHCPRVDRFMRAAAHSPTAEIRAIAREYSAGGQPEHP